MLEVGAGIGDFGDFGIEQNDFRNLVGQFDDDQPLDF